MLCKILEYKILSTKYHIKHQAFEKAKSNRTS
jgi:hypothetical protein